MSACKQAKSPVSSRAVRYSSVPLCWSGGKYLDVPCLAVIPDLEIGRDQAQGVNAGGGDEEAVGWVAVGVAGELGALESGFGIQRKHPQARHSGGSMHPLAGGGGETDFFFGAQHPDFPHADCRDMQAMRLSGLVDGGKRCGG